MRTDPYPVQEAQRPHQENGSQRTFCVPPPKRGDDAVPERHSSARLLQSPAEFDVFHQRNLGEPAEQFKHVAADKEGLVAGRDACQARPVIHEGTDDSTPSRGAVESDVEAPTHGGVLGQR